MTRPLRAAPKPSSAHDDRSRRDALRTLGVGLAILPFAKLLGCGGGDSDAAGTAGSGAAGAGTAGAGTAGSGTAGSATAGASGSGTAGSGTAGSGGVGGWATGGTASMTGKSSYPNPFSGASGTSCAMLCTATIGPCHTTSPQRNDVSNGIDGLPMRLALRVVDEACNPVKGAIVEIWHTNYKGIYSGNIASICNKDAADQAANYFRGYLVTDQDGRVDFDSCFPGWYSGRAVHIHFRIIQGAYDPADNATATLISQFFFTDELLADLFSSQPLYKDRGQPDTLLGTDNVVGGTADKTPYILDVQQMSDGAMLASKTIVIKSSSTSSCTLQGSGMGGPMGGGPPGG